MEDWIQSSDENSRTLKLELPQGLLNLDDAETQDWYHQRRTGITTQSVDE